MKDLVVLCPDIRWKATLEAILGRDVSLGIRPITADVRQVPGRTDGWVRTHGAAFLQAVRPMYAHGVLVFDHDGCNDPRPADEIEQELDNTLEPAWFDRAGAVVVEPELEERLVGTHRWIPQLGGGAAGVRVRAWFASSGFWPDEQPKPDRPKDAIETLLRSCEIAPSSATYRKIASGASLRTDRCRSRSYHRFVHLLRQWFPAEANAP